VSTFPVVFRFDAQAVGVMRNEVKVMSAEPASGGTYDLTTDEGPMHGGDASAPTPLHLFTAALAGCFMTQMRAFAKRLGVRLDGLRVTGVLEWQGYAEGRAPYVTEPVGFALTVHADSPMKTRELLGLVSAAKRGCFVEQTLADGVRVRHELHHAGQVVDVEAAEIAEEAIAETAG
jgi:uncharacterized OsmC-like protein